MVARPPAGPALPSPPRQGSTAAPRGRGGELGRPAGSARPRAEEGLAREAARGRRGARAEAGLGLRLHSAVSGREDLPPPPPLLHLQPARDAAASFPQCTLALEGALSSLSPPPPPSSPATFPADGHAHSSASDRVWRGGGGARSGCLSAHAHNPTHAKEKLRMRPCLLGLQSRNPGISDRPRLGFRSQPGKRLHCLATHSIMSAGVWEASSVEAGSCLPGRMQGTQNELVTYNLNSFPRKPVTYKEEEHTHCHLMSFHTVAEHIPYARHWPSCVGNQSWVKHVPWSPGEAHDLVEESDMYINNYNVCQNEDGVSIPPGPTAV